MTTFLLLSLILIQGYGTYITTCHNDAECGSTCGTYGDDTVGPSEGLFGVSCSCQNGQPPTYLCNRDGQNVYVCSDYQPPRCNVPCNQKICIQKDGKRATATIRTACPKHHPQNTGDCCKYGGSYCTCIFQDTLDLNWKPYAELGGNNGYSSGATWGACGNENTGIDVFSEEGQQWIADHFYDNCDRTQVSETQSRDDIIQKLRGWQKIITQFD